MLKKIISGGQTGVDRAALDAAIDSSFPYGGFVPKGRIAEDGVIPSKYAYLIELTRKDYVFRTRKNIEESDGTVIIYNGRFGRGTRYTINYAEKINKPVLKIDLSRVLPDDAVKLLLDFIDSHNIRILNVAGPRLSIDPEIYKAAYSLIRAILP